MQHDPVAATHLPNFSQFRNPSAIHPSAPGAKYLRNRQNLSKDRFLPNIFGIRRFPSIALRRLENSKIVFFQRKSCGLRKLKNRQKKPCTLI